MRLLLLLVLALLAVPQMASAQDAASATWALIEADTTSVTTTGGIAAIPVRSSSLVIRDYTGTLTGSVEGPLGPYQRWWLDGEVWPDDMVPVADRYVEFVVAAGGDVPLAVDSLRMTINAGGTSAMRASVFSSTDPSFAAPTALLTEETLSRDDVATFTFEVDETLTGTDSLYVRVYPWVRSSSTGSGRNLYLQDVSIWGTTTAAPTDVEGVFWALTAADTTSVSAAGGGLGGAPVRASTLTVRDYDGDLRDAGDAPGPLGLFQRWWLDGGTWPDEDARVDDRYVAFAAAASDPFAFRVDSVSVYIHGDGTSAMRASVFYSTASDFSDPVALEEGLQAGDGDFGGPTLRTYPLGVTLPAGDSLYVRIYPWVRSSTTGAGRYLLLQAMTIHGEAVTITATEGEEAGATHLVSTFPNPTRGAATVRFELAEAGDVSLDVVDLLGRRVATLASGSRGAGVHEVAFDADLAAGVYLVRLAAGTAVSTSRVTVVR